MGYYKLSKEDRQKTNEKIKEQITTGLKSDIHDEILAYCSDTDTYIRKQVYLQIGRLFLMDPKLHKPILSFLKKYLSNSNFHVRQTIINAAGEIGMTNFEIVEDIFDIGLMDSHHSPRNAVIGSIKKMGQRNPKPVLTWCTRYTHHNSIEIRREICHGLELRGRTHPEDILPILKEFQWEKSSRVRKMLIHVLGQISYKQGCLEKVLHHLQHWENKSLLPIVCKEILIIHERYKNFSYYSSVQANTILEKWMLSAYK